VTPLRDRDILIYAAIGFSVWLNGALTFWLGGQGLFESGPAVSLLVAVAIAISVCLIYRSTMRWRKTDITQAVPAAVAMLLPGLFGEVVRQLVFPWATGLKPAAQPAFVATILFGNAVLLAYALWRGR
jgi:hypothetical protein